MDSRPIIVGILWLALYNSVHPMYSLDLVKLQMTHTVILNQDVKTRSGMNKMCGKQNLDTHIMGFHTLEKILLTNLL
jgi:hypothetical protein